jgi:hypothetical protein
MKKISLFICLFILLMVVGCGSGGGDNDNTITHDGYSGLSTQSYIDVDNALTLTEGADLGLYGLYSLPKLLKKTVSLVMQKLQASPKSLFPYGETCINYPNGTTSDSLQQFGSGSIVTINGNVDFDNCAFGEYVGSEVVIFDGTVSVSATYDTSAALMTMFEMTMSAIQADYYEGSAPFNLIGRMAGSESYADVSGYQVFDYTIEVTLNDVLGNSYWLNDYHIIDTFDENSFGTSTLFSGRYYDNEYGYVDFSTNEPIFVPDYPVSRTPYSGLVEYTGSDGSMATILLWGIYGDQCINGSNLSGDFVLGSCTLF